MLISYSLITLNYNRVRLKVYDGFGDGNLFLGPCSFSISEIHKILPGYQLIKFLMLGHLKNIY